MPFFPVSAQTPTSTPKPKIIIPDSVQVVDNVEMGTGGSRPLMAKLAFPKEPSKTLLPAVIWIHGGGWAKGSHKVNDAMYLAEHGYFTASAEYRLSGEAPWPAQLEDCKLAVRWLRANAAKYNVDPNRIGIWGASAGGHLVVCLAAMDDPKWEGKGGYEGVSSKVAAVVDVNGPVDFSRGSAAAFCTPPGEPDTYESKPVIQLFGGGSREKGEVWKEGSPLLYVKANLPPFLIIHGDNDLSVAYDQSVKLKEALEKVNVPVEMITVKEGGHSLMNPTPGKGQKVGTPNFEERRAAVLAFFDKTLKK